MYVKDPETKPSTLPEATAVLGAENDNVLFDLSDSEDYEVLEGEEDAREEVGHMT